MVIDQPLVRCIQCGQENPAEARFCMRCGTALARRCPGCGAANRLDAQFCQRCGTPLAGATATERRVVSVLFADLVGSTQLVLNIDPEPMRALIAQYFSAMREEIERYGGVVEKFIGDAVMAVFGLPNAHEDDADRAVRAAVAMQRRMAELNAQGGHNLRMRVGIATGEVIADPASVSRGQFMVTGEAVNMAFRLQAQAPTDGIVLDERTFRALRVHGEFKPLPPAGDGDFPSLPRWQVIMISEGAPARRLWAPLVGRDDELQFLLALHRRVVDSRRQHLITITGTAGVGKSRLVEEFEALVRTEPNPPRVLRGRCPSYGEGLTYWPLAEMVKQECAIKDNDPPQVMLDKLRAATARITVPIMGAEESDSVTADLAALLGLSVTRPYEAMWRERLVALKQVVESRPAVAEAPPGEGRRSAVDILIPSIRAFFVALARQAPVILVFEDLHWAQESLLNVLERVGVRGPDIPILTLCLARPELLERRPDWGARMPSYTSLSLHPLPVEQSRSLISELLDGEDMPADVREAILNRAEGNPFFIEEILRRLIDGGELVRDERGWRLASPSVEIRIPDTIHGILASRLDLLTPLEKRVILDASVAGRVFWLNAAAAMGDMPPAEAEAALERLADRDLIEERPVSSFAGEREFAFTHALIREVAYSMMPKMARSARHLRFAGWLQEASRRPIEESLDVLAYHFEQAWRNAFDTGERAEDLARQAVAALSKAGARAMHLRTLPEARGLYERALAIVRNADLTGDHALYLELLVEYTEVIKWMPAYKAVLEATDAVLKDAPRIGRDDLVARAWLNRAYAESDKGRLKEADEALRRALELFRRLGDRLGEAETLEVLGGVTSDLRGSLQTAEEAYRQVIELYREMGDGMGMARTMTWMGRAQVNTGRLAEAKRTLEEALRLGRQHHERISEAKALMGLAIIAHLQGRSAESVALHHQVINFWQELGNPIEESGVRRHLAMHYLRQGKIGEAEEEIRKAQAVRRQHGIKSESPMILRSMAEIVLAKGELLAAADLAERAVAALTDYDDISFATHRATLGKVRAAQGRAEESEDLFRRSLEHLETKDYRIDFALVLMKYGESLIMLEQPERARPVLERAQREFAAMGAMHFADVIERTLRQLPFPAALQPEALGG